MNGSSKGWLPAPWAAVSILGLCGAQAACTAELAGTNPNRTDVGGQAGSGGSGGSGSVTPQDCNGSEVAMPRRLIRLSFNQIAVSLRPIFGDAFADKVIADNMIGPATTRTFPPLGDTAEGTAYIDARWQSADAIATATGKHALDNFAAFTGCATPTAECATAFIGKLAEKAYRRPLDPAEASNLQTVYTEVTAAGGTIPQAVQASVSAIYSSPGFLYRTEFGAGAAAGPVPLTQFELASQLSYFLTDGAPDDGLLAAAAKNELTTDEQIGAHVDRILALPSTRKNLQDMVFAAFGIARVDSVVVDGLPAEVFNNGVRASMFRESQLFINDVLWGTGKVSDLVTSRKAFINARLAPLYEVAAPTVLDADGFGPVELPANRAGILTSLGFLTSRARPDQQSVVGRGLAVNDSILCQQNPAFPEALAAQIEDVNSAQHDLSERERAEYRQKTSPCLGCHVGFDPYGVALENFDVIGRFRTSDPQGRPIDASVKLPPIAGGSTAANAVEVGQALATTGAFASCVGTKLITYALAETGVAGRSCASKAVANKFATTDQSFGALVRAVALSKSLTQRSGE